MLKLSENLIVKKSVENTVNFLNTKMITDVQTTVNTDGNIAQLRVMVQVLDMGRGIRSQEMVINNLDVVVANSIMQEINDYYSQF